MILKYFGPEDGKTVYNLIFPKPPRLLVFTIPCKVCGASSHYSRNDVEGLSTEEAPETGFVDQIPETVVKVVAQT